MTSLKLISAKELAAVTALPGPRRYAHVIAQCADWQTVWGLRAHDGWVSAKGTGENIAFAIWPHEPYARQCATGQWAEAQPGEIELNEFLDSVVPGLLANKSQLAIFPTPAGSVVIVPIKQFVEDIRNELSRIE